MAAAALKKAVDLRHVKRKIVEGSIEKIENIISEVFTEDNLDLVEANRELLVEQTAEIKQMDDEIAQKSSGDDVVEDLQLANEFHFRVKLICRKVERFSQKGRVFDSKDSDISPGGSRSSATKLPKLEIRKFNGDSRFFTTFKDCFSAAVDGSHTLSAINKFTYLKARRQIM